MRRHFDGVDAANAYWKGRVATLQEALRNKDEEWEEFQRDTKDYEAELETEIKRYEKDKAEWQQRRQALEADNAQLKVRACPCECGIVTTGRRDCRRPRATLMLK